VPIVPELELAYDEFEGPLIAVTGTNGKTTVTALTAHALQAAGMDAVAGGNIGTALSELVLREPQPEVVVAEVSSFQLGRTHHFAPSVGVLTNLAPDHLDWYATVDDYYADKARLFATARPESRWVLNGEDDAVIELAADAPGDRYLFRVAGGPAVGERGGYLDTDGWLTIRLDEGDERVIHASELKIMGPHNIANSLAATLAAKLVGASTAGIAEGLRTFAPMDHRLEPVIERGGVLWVNDSKATNIASTSVAIRSIDRPTILLLGGRHKGEEYAHLVEVMRDRVRAVIAYGEAGERIEAALESAVPVHRVEGDFAAILRRAAEMARPGDAVLLSPACSSYDMFRDYEDRGTQFRRIVTEEVA
jgi:UDP-N-acetylmuramoylalanine--D-glutamate ligase